MYHTVSQKDLTLTLRGAGICILFWLTNLIKGFNVDLRALLEAQKVLIGGFIEGDDTVPSCFALAL